MNLGSSAASSLTVAGSLAPINQINRIYRAYEALAGAFPSHPDAGLGGKLFYAGEVTELSRQWLYAANIAGAASLVASADGAIQRQAIRDGVVDFSVTSLEEALRILKNEIRKRQPVSVVVGISPEDLVVEMLDRGVLPDLLPHFIDGPGRVFHGQGALEVGLPANPDEEFVIWAVNRDSGRWLPKLDACAISAIPSEDIARQRWLRLAPRYLGRMTQRRHGVVFTAEEAALFRAEVETLMAADGDGSVQVEILAQRLG